MIFDVVLGLTVDATDVQEAVRKAADMTLHDPGITVLVGPHHGNDPFGQNLTHVVRLSDLAAKPIEKRTA